MDTDPCCRARRPSDQVSTKPGELHLGRICGLDESVRCFGRCAVEVQGEARLGSTEEAAGSIPADRLDGVIASTASSETTEPFAAGGAWPWPAAAGSGTCRRGRCADQRCPEGTAGPRCVGASR